MKYYIVEDSCFIVAVMDSRDPFHGDAFAVFKEILKIKDKIKVIIPPLVLYEAIVVLSKKCINHAIIERKVLELLHRDEVIVFSVAETAVFKHCKNLLGTVSGFSLKAADFMIASLAIDCEAQILTFDEKIIKRVKPVYDKIYCCSDLCKGISNGTSDFLNDLNRAVNLLPS